MPPFKVFFTGDYLDESGVQENRAARPLVEGVSAWRMRSAERIDARTDAAGTVVFSQANYPGWKAWVDGAPAEVSDEDGLFPSVRVPRGASSVRFQFAPGAWFLGVFVSLVSLACLLARALAGSKRWIF